MQCSNNAFDDDALAIALDLSAAEARQPSQEPVLIDVTRSSRRGELPPPIAHHFPPVVAAAAAAAAAAAGGVVAAAPLPGLLIELNTLDQFHGTFGASIDEFEAPSALCGYFTVAHCRLLRSALSAAAASAGPGGPGLAGDPVAAAVATLSDPVAVHREVRRAMRQLRAARAAYVGAHPAEFAAEPARRSYMKAWVANYEISGEGCLAG